MKFISLEAITGEINAAEGSGKAHLFHAPCSGSEREGEKEQFISTAVKECPALGTKGHAIKALSRRNIREDIGKAVYQTTWALKDGEVFKVFAKANTGGADWKFRERTACVFIKVRDGAPLTLLKVKVPGCIPDSQFPYWHIRGNFDVLTLAEAEALGALVLDSCRDHFSPSAVSALFEKEELAPATVAAPVVATKEVGGRVMAVRVPRRKLNLSSE